LGIEKGRQEEEGREIEGVGRRTCVMIGGDEDGGMNLWRGRASGGGLVEEEMHAVRDWDVGMWDVVVDEMMAASLTPVGEEDEIGRRGLGWRDDAVDGSMDEAGGGMDRLGSRG
jgi:hypothetical protein